MSEFTPNYKPIAGTLTISLTAGVVWELDPATIPVGANRATIAPYGDRIHYLSTGEDPSSNFGRPVPDGEEALLNNKESIAALKVIPSESDCFLTIAFFNGNR